MRGQGHGPTGIGQRTTISLRPAPNAMAVSMGEMGGVGIIYSDTAHPYAGRDPHLGDRSPPPDNVQGRLARGCAGCASLSSRVRSIPGSITRSSGLGTQSEAACQDMDPGSLRRRGDGVSAVQHTGAHPRLACTGEGR